MPEKKKCDHTLKENKQEDFIFCTKCGKRWQNTDYKCFKPIVIKSSPNITHTHNPYFTGDDPIYNPVTCCK